MLAHQEREEHGTGFVKQNFNVLAIVSPEFKRVGSGWFVGRGIIFRFS